MQWLSSVVNDAYYSVRRRIRNGWQVWETTRGTYWARAYDRSGQQLRRIETEEITPPEGYVLDKVLLEEASRRAEQSGLS